MSEQTTTPAQKDPEQEALWTDFCEKTFKLGQLLMHIEQTKGALADLEKKYEHAMKNARGAADKHDKYVTSKKMPPAPTQVNAEVVQ